MKMAESSRIIRTILLSLLLVANIAALHCNGGRMEEDQLPSMWSDDSVSDDRAYHMIYQLELFNTQETLNLEEWADFKNHLFRLDIISLTSRVTLLTNGQTGETIYYKPFICGPIDKNSTEISSLMTLFKGYPINQNKPDTLVYGFGPLWLKARAEAIEVTRLETTKANYEVDYTAYKVKFSPTGREEDINYDLKFYFGNHAENAIEWIVNTKENNQIVEARALVNGLDSLDFDRNVFELPIGYGCKRSADYDYQMDIDIGQEPLHPGLANEINLEISASRPLDNLMQSWDTNKYSVQILRGQLRSASSDKLEIYYAAVTQFRDKKTSRFNRQRRVWKSRDGLDQAVMYTMDETGNARGSTGCCKIEHVLASDYVKFALPGQTSETKPMALSAGTILNLFKDQEDYHEIRVGQRLGAKKFRDTYYEKRMSAFSTCSSNDEDEINLAGPVSIVKHIDYVGSSLNSFNDSATNHSARLQLSRDYRTTLILFFYSDNYEKLRYKVVVDILNNQDISSLRLLKHLDISPCVGIDTQSSSTSNDNSRKNIEDIVIKYPVRDFNVRDVLQTNSETILDLFARNLFKETPIAPLQVTNLHLDMDKFFAYLKMTLLDLTSYQTFDLRPQQRLVNAVGVKRSSVFETTSSSRLKCSILCDYHGCFRFSYDPSRLRCRLELHKDGATTEGHLESDLYEFAPQAACNLSIIRPFCDDQTSGARHHLSPRVIIEMFQAIIDASPDSMQDEYGGQRSEGILNLWHESAGTTAPGIHIRPIAVNHDLDSLRELVKLSDGDDDLTVAGSDSLKLQYALLLDDKYFHPNSGQEFEASTYEDCAKFCEDSDCRSFAYCPASLNCLVTPKHSSKDIQASQTDRSGCEIYTLDYMSKFEDFGAAQYPAVAQRKQVDEMHSARDCANSCMDESGFACQGFYFCHNGASSSNECLLQDKHIEESVNKYQPKFRPNSLVLKEGRECKFYSRSYLAQFDQYHGKTLEFPAQLSDSRTLIKGMGAEKCARRCIDRQCLAFDICVETNSKFFGQSCQLAAKEIKQTHLVSKRQCTTFVLSDKSQFKRRQSNGSAAIDTDGSRPDKSALDGDSTDIVLDPAQVEAEKEGINAAIFKLVKDSKSGSQISKIISGSHWLTRLLCFAGGMLLGSVGLMVANEIYARSSRQRLL